MFNNSLFEPKVLTNFQYFSHSDSTAQHNDLSINLASVFWGLM